jgi:hypothetical protein
MKPLPREGIAQAFAFLLSFPNARVLTGIIKSPVRTRATGCKFIKTYIA